MEKETITSQVTAPGDLEAIFHFEQAIKTGKHWFLALLEAMGLWASVEETFQGRTCRYLIDGEAFDWLLLTERLCREMEGLLPAAERDALLFHAKPPLRLSAEEVKKLVGESKYCQYLNFFYGVTVEGMLLLAVQEEIQKEKLPGVSTEERTAEEAFQRVYGKSRSTLLESFRAAKEYSQKKSVSLAEMKEFTYWLFKYRLAQSEKAKVASDTKKALAYLKIQWARHGFFGALINED